MGRGEDLASWGLVLSVTWEPSAWEEPNWEALLPSWEIAPSVRGYCLPGNYLSESYCFGKHVKHYVWLSTRLLGLPGVCLAGRHHSLPGKECCLLGKMEGCLPWRPCSLPEEEHCLPRRLEGCLPGRLCYLPGKEHWLLGKPACLLPKGLLDCLPVSLTLYGEKPQWPESPACLLP